MRRHPLARLVLAAVMVAGTMQATSGWFGVVTTRGVSMQPTFHEGDVVLTRRAGGYGVGDVIAYRSPELENEVVLHRVIRVDGDRYVTQGDNNDWIDDEQPTKDRVIGVAFFRIPGAGRYLAPVRGLGPAITGALASALFAFALQRRRHRRRDEDDPQQRRRPARERAVTPLQLPALAARLTTVHLAVGAAACAALAAFAFSTPSDVLTSSPTGYEHTATFDYAAPAATSIVYADGSVDVGDPIFRSAVDRLTVGVDYALDGGESVGGELVLEVGVQVGQWDHLLATGPPVALDDGAGRATVDVDLAEIDAVVADFSRVSGQPAQAPKVVVRGTVDAAGTIDGSSFTTSFEPELALAMSETEVNVDPERLEQQETGSVTTAAARPAALGLPLGRTVPVPAARALGAGGTVLLGALAALSANGGRRGPGRRTLDPVPQSPRIVHVTSFQPSPKVVEVTDVDTLLKIAEEYDRFVLCVTDGMGRRSFAVEDAGTTYRTAATWVP